MRLFNLTELEIQHIAQLRQVSADHREMLQDLTVRLAEPASTTPIFHQNIRHLALAK